MTAVLESPNFENIKQTLSVYKLNGQATKTAAKNTANIRKVGPGGNIAPMFEGVLIAHWVRQSIARHACGKGH